MNKPYWETEKPVTERTGRIIVSYYPVAGKLQVASYILIGQEVRRQKVVVFDGKDLQKHPEAARLLLQAISEMASFNRETPA